MLPIVDTHQHLWDLEKLELPWLASVDSLNQSYLIGDYLETSKNQNVIKSVYMEVDVAASQKDLEVELITEVCKDAANPMAGMVISGYPEKADFKNTINQHRNNPYVKGVRRVLHVPETARGACLEEQFIESIRYLGESGLLFSLCMRPAELEDAVKLVKLCPETRFILDHCGNPDPQINNGAEILQQDNNPFWHSRELWFQNISELAAQPNVICKISGIIARVLENWTPQVLAATVNHCLDTFGSERVIFGGDWPVCTLGASFEDWANALREVIQDRSEDEQKQLLSENAIRIYQL